ncbi:FAD:protein FMN transferase [soil metagenome]
MIRRAQPWLGSMVEISIFDEMDTAALNRAFHTAFAVIGQIHRLMSFQSQDSEVTQINQAGVGAVLTLDAHTYTVIAAALRVCQASAGLFDIRVAERLTEWAYLPHHSDADLSLPAYPGYQGQQQAWCLLNDHQLQKLRHDRLDLGGIAKGYAVDQAILALRKAGVQQACVNAGGDLRVIGAQAIAVGIRDPAAPARMIKTISLQNQALATSGTYFSARLHGQQAVSALVHGQTGQALLDVGSISVRAAECIWADALTKVVAASADPTHPCLAQFAADAFIIGASG